VASAAEGLTLGDIVGVAVGEMVGSRVMPGALKLGRCITIGACETKRRRKRCGQRCCVAHL
jgi:uncharacterized protein YqgC (DUF456 family)